MLVEYLIHQFIDLTCCIVNRAVIHASLGDHKGATELFGSAM